MSKLAIHHYVEHTGKELRVHDGSYAELVVPLSVQYQPMETTALVQLRCAEEAERFLFDLTISNRPLGMEPTDR